MNDLRSILLADVLAAVEGDPNCSADVMRALQRIDAGTLIIPDERPAQAGTVGHCAIFAHFPRIETESGEVIRDKWVSPPCSQSIPVSRRNN